MLVKTFFKKNNNGMRNSQISKKLKQVKRSSLYFAVPDETLAKKAATDKLKRLSSDP